MTHRLLQQQLQELNLSPDQQPDSEQWRALLAEISAAYEQSEQTYAQWRSAYDSLREEMEGSYEMLRRSSADLITRERDKLQAVIHSVGEGLCALNENGCLLFINAEGEQLLGWDELTVRGQLILDWIMPSGNEATTTEQLIETVSQGNTYEEHDAPFIRQDGRHFPASFKLTPIMKDGEFNGAVLVFRNISEFKRTQEERERQLRETLLLYRVIAAATSTLDVTAILQTICTELAHFFGLPQAACGVLNEKGDALTIVAEYLDEGRVPAIGAKIPLHNNPATQQVIRTKKPLVIADAQTDERQPALHELARRRGTKSILIIPLLVQGRVLGTLGLNTTVRREFTESEVSLAQNVALAASQALANAQLYTAVQQELAERRRAEEALEQARDKALEASRLKSELVAKVSHELRTPLTSILGFVEMIQLGIYGEVNNAQVDTLGKVLQSTENLVVLVNDLLNLAQLEAGMLKLNEIAFAPRELIGRMESTMRILAEAKDLALISELDEALPNRLLGDPDRLHQILINLVNNAVKFTPAGEIRACLLKLNESLWAIKVSDTGPGIPENMQPYIFDEFRQVDYSATREHKGVGLGLSIVKQLTTAMGGVIALESKLGHGSTFTVTLPLKLPEASPYSVNTFEETVGK